MKYLLVSLMLLLLPMINAHHLLGSFISEADQVPIENHLSDTARLVLEEVVDGVSQTHCQDSKCEKGLVGYFSSLFGLLLSRFD